MNNLRTLLPRLVISTDENNLKWKRSEEEDAFYTQLANHPIHIEMRYDEDTGNPWIIATLGSMQKNFALDTVKSDKYENEYELLERLFLAARRSAFDVDKVVTDMEKALDSLDLD